MRLSTAINNIQKLRACVIYIKISSKMVPFACDSGHGDACCKSKWGFLPKTAQCGRYYRDSDRKQTSSRHYFALPRVSRQLLYLRSSVLDFDFNDFDRLV